MNSSTKLYKGFVQDPTYAVHFKNYLNLLSKVLNHDLAMFSLDKNARIVDVGCGYGNLLITLRSRGYKKLFGIEPDAICRQSCLKKHLAVREGTISKTGLANAFADVVIINQVFHHIKDFNAAVDELTRILKPGGVLCFMEPSPTLLRRAMDVLTFRTPLPNLVGFVKTRYEVMHLEMETGLYPYFLNHQTKFLNAIKRGFSPVWHRQSWFFQFGMYKKKK
jgi:SAM-dependent methyltransferase